MPCTLTGLILQVSLVTVPVNHLASEKAHLLPACSYHSRRHPSSPPPPTPEINAVGSRRDGDASLAKTDLESHMLKFSHQPL